MTRPIDNSQSFPDCLNTEKYEEAAKELLSLIPKEEKERVFGHPQCEISPEFLGFITTYKALADLIPRDWTIVDFGASYNPQCYYFKNHKRYIAVEPETGLPMFKAPNCEIFECTTKEFVLCHMNEVLQDEKVFAICNYVQKWYGQDSIRIMKEKFRYVFTFYPEH